MTTNPTRCPACGNPVAQPTEHSPEVAALVKERDAYKLLSEGLDDLNMCYRLGTRRGAETALTKIERARKALARVQGRKEGQ